MLKICSWTSVTQAKRLQCMVLLKMLPFVATLFAKLPVCYKVFIQTSNDYIALYVLYKYILKTSKDTEIRNTYGIS